MRGFPAALMLALCVWIAPVSRACAQDNLLDSGFIVDIAAQDLSSAVITLSKQAGAQVVMPAGKLDRFETRGLHGRMSLRQALARLLHVTPYRFYQSGGSTIIIDATEAASITR